LILMLNMLEQFDLAALGQNSSARYHLLAEVMKRAYADRSEFIGDPAFTRVPVRGLVSKAYAEERAKSIGFMQATPSKNIRQGQPARHESANTTHFSIVDVAGNVVANTYTLRNFYGSGVTVGGAGFLLNNVMDDYATKPGEANSFGYVAGQVNEVGAGKRPVSSQTPTVVNKAGKFWMALGAQGGPTITNSVLQVLTNMIDHGMDLQEAVDAPRIHHQWLPDILRYEPGGLAIDVIAALEKRGHKLGLLPKGAPGSVNAVSVNGVSSLRLGAADPRNPDGAARGC
jgi:gamma-glutamyltranspeptidase/glutathione hydrolase